MFIASFVVIHLFIAPFIASSHHRIITPFIVHSSPFVLGLAIAHPMLT